MSSLLYEKYISEIKSWEYVKYVIADQERG